MTEHFSTNDNEKVNEFLRKKHQRRKKEEDEKEASLMKEVEDLKDEVLKAIELLQMLDNDILSNIQDIIKSDLPTKEKLDTIEKLLVFRKK